MLFILLLAVKVNIHARFWALDMAKYIDFFETGVSILIPFFVTMQWIAVRDVEGDGSRCTNNMLVNSVVTPARGRRASD